MEPTIGEIRIFAGNFAPRSWAFCEGQLLPINQNQALFSILGTTYGGDGRTTFGLPDLRGRTAIHAGNGPGLSDRRLGSKGGTERVTLNQTQIPSHNHTDVMRCNNTSSDSDLPNGRFLGFISASSSNGNAIPIIGYASSKQLGIPIGNTSITGENQSIDIRQPWLAMHYIIAIFGIFPSRN